MKKRKISILIPCHNEEKGVGRVIDEVPLAKLHRYGYIVEIIVIDNKSTDKTAIVASAHGARVITEENKGKGNALRTAFNILGSDVWGVVILDGDNTYKAREIPRLIEPLESNFADVIVGSRLGGKMKRHSFQLQNRVANWFYTFLIRHFYRANTTDVLSGFFALKKKVIDELNPHLDSRGFAIEMEMNIKIAKAGYEIFSVPITYDTREGESKVDVLKDGLRIFYAFVKYYTWNPKKIKKVTTEQSSEEYLYA